MKVFYSNYKDFYKNPTSGDFANGLVDLRRKHLNDIISIWEVFDEDTRGTLQGNPSNFNYLSIYTQMNKAPNIIKIITEDGFEGFFYKRNMGAIVNDSKDSNQIINYELNKGDTYLYYKFEKLNNLNPYVETLNLHSDILIFYGNLNDFDTSQVIYVGNETEESIREAFNQVIKADTDNGKTGDINDFYDLAFDTSGKTFTITPKKNNDIEYLVYTPTPDKPTFILNYQIATKTIPINEIEVGNYIGKIIFPEDFDLNNYDGNNFYFGIENFTYDPRFEINSPGYNNGAIVNLNLEKPQKINNIYDIITGGNKLNGIYDDVSGDFDTKTITLNNYPKITQTNFNTISSFGMNCLITTNPQNTQQDILGFRFNILEQKQFGDTNISDNFQLVRKLIGSKTADELYTYNEINPDDTIELKCYDSSISSASSITHNITYRDLDNYSFDEIKNCYKCIGCKMSALKHVKYDDVYESMGAQFQLYAPIGDNQIKLLDKIGDGLEPQTSSVTPTPFNVLFAPFSTGSKLTDTTLSDIPNGLIFGLGLKQLSTSEAIFVNNGTFDSINHKIDYNGSDTNSFPLLKFPTNQSISIKISGLSEVNSLENKIKTMIENICYGIYDMDTEPLFLNPKYFYEAIVYDNTNFIRIDASGINYEIKANELENDGLVLNANFCINDNMSLYYSFDKTSENSKIGNNELNILGNNTKTNLGVVNNRTTLELGSNAENLANGGALASYVGYQNYKTKLEQQNLNYDFNQAYNGFGVVGNAIKDFAGGKIGTGIKDIFTGGANIGLKNENFKMDILNQNRAYNAQISQIRSANAINVSAPYSTSFGKQAGLFTRYSYEIQDGNKISKFKEINKNGYFYKDVLPFQRWDNRVYGNALKISNATNYKYIAQQLQDDSNFGAYEYGEEMLLGLMGGVRIWNISKMNDENEYQNLPKILPPYENQKIDGRKFFYGEKLNKIGLIGDDSMSWEVNGDLRTRIILALQTQTTPDIPQNLLNDLNSSNFEFKGDAGNLIIKCDNDSDYLPTFEEIGNVLITSKSKFTNIGNFIINDYANLKDYFDLHIESYLNISKQTGNWESEDYSYLDETHLHIQIKNNFINLTILDYNFEKTDTQSIGKLILCGDLNIDGNKQVSTSGETSEAIIKINNSNDDKHCFPFITIDGSAKSSFLSGLGFTMSVLIYYKLDFLNFKFKDVKPTNSTIQAHGTKINNDIGFVFTQDNNLGSNAEEQKDTTTYNFNFNLVDSLNFSLDFPTIHWETKKPHSNGDYYNLTIDTKNNCFKSDNDSGYHGNPATIEFIGYEALNEEYNLPTTLNFKLSNADFSFKIQQLTYGE